MVLFNIGVDIGRRVQLFGSKFPLSLVASSNQFHSRFSKQIFCCFCLSKQVTLKSKNNFWAKFACPKKCRTERARNKLHFFQRFPRFHHFPNFSSGCRVSSLSKIFIRLSTFITFQTFHQVADFHHFPNFSSARRLSSFSQLFVMLSTFNTL